MVTTLVLGGYGAVGAQVMAELKADGHVVLAAGRDRARADRVVELRDLGSYARALAQVDLVINASGLEDPALVALASDHGAAFIDISASTKYIAALERLEPRRPVLLSVGLAPGLTNLLAAAVHAAAPGPIDLALLLGAGERHGEAATRWSYSLLGKTFVEPTDGSSVRNYTQPRHFDLPGHGIRRLFRADFSDQHTLTRDFGTAVRTYFGLDSRLATTALAALTWVPGAAKLPMGFHLPGTDRWLALAVGSHATVRWASGRGQSRATAMIAAVAARAVLRLPAGVHHLHGVLTLEALPEERGILISS
jgi:saccharopine dehydrogenase-like NADP-dependent oxidoreductase